MKKTPREQLPLSLGSDKRSSPERTLEVSCLNRRAKFVAYYGDEEEETDTVEVQKCGLCRGNEFNCDNFKHATIRIVAQVTARR
jgi:hypothetical protein